MKSKQQLMYELHQLIDSIEDEAVLNVLNDDVVPYMIQKEPGKNLSGKRRA